MEDVTYVTWKTRVICSVNSLGTTHLTMQHLIPEDWNPQLCRSENLKTHMSVPVSQTRWHFNPEDSNSI
jgi:hypothetical protein